jgi:hypothetical protein
MSIERRHSPEHWRDRAKEIRAKADNCEYPETRDALRNTAECYDALARSIENIRTVRLLMEKADAKQQYSFSALIDQV